MSINRWLRISFFNLLLVAILGILLRYKIAFSLPFIDQKNILHSHSHFAFTGWITQSLMVLMVYYLQKQHLENIFSKYKYLLFLNLLCAYGMLFCFAWQGYAFFSICFSTLSIFTAYTFAYSYWKDLRKIQHTGITHSWFKAALIFNVMSSFGAFGLAIIMVLKLVNLKLYLFCTYYFLHFQYNGFFFFVCMGLFFSALKSSSSNTGKKIFWPMAIACIPAYFLSALWAAIHPLAYWLVVIASIAQTVGWIFFLQFLFKNKETIKETFTKNSRRILALSVLACTIKIILQQFSVIPYLSTLAFGFRPIVIGYLHLVLLGVISTFLIGYTVSLQALKTNSQTYTGIAIFIGGIILNELLLMIQGVGAIVSTSVPYINEYLFITALIMFGGLLTLNISIRKPFNPDHVGS